MRTGVSQDRMCWLMAIVLLLSVDVQSTENETDNTTSLNETNSTTASTAIMKTSPTAAVTYTTVTTSKSIPDTPKKTESPETTPSPLIRGRDCILCIEELMENKPLLLIDVLFLSLAAVLICTLVLALRMCFLKKLSKDSWDFKNNTMDTPQPVTEDERSETVSLMDETTKPEQEEQEDNHTEQVEPEKTEVLYEGEAEAAPIIDQAPVEDLVQPQEPPAILPPEEECKMAEDDVNSVQ